MFRGSASATVDDRGRLKIPTDFRRLLEERWGLEVFITSPFGDAARVYPLPVWEELETRLLAMPSTDKARNRFLERVNYFGQQTRLDPQGRVLIPQLLRERAGMSGEVVVAGRIDYLEVWNHERFTTRLEAEPLTDDDLKALSERGF
jgi:transcriptional regulator MraZ